ncbi:hypothetical protein Hanom_Chr10g00872641 [Helianthus anomalus]
MAQTTGTKMAINSMILSIREAERERAARRPPPPPPRDLSTRRLLFTIAIAGIAIFLGSLLFQRKPDISQAN